ncbi:MAG: HPF/RaiA family ribosome-associated protein [Xanthomonadales bacterium]|nr:HPF/RaiA family ribosome-associated protein [Xanthomonadales bacterium]
MKIQINTDNNIQGRDALTERYTDEVTNALANVSKHVTRVEIHLSDENGSKSGQDDKRCLMEARLEGRQPIAVTENAATLDLALHGACHKLVRMISGIVDAQRDSKRQPSSMPGDGLPPAED